MKRKKMLNEKGENKFFRPFHPLLPIFRFPPTPSASSF
jgi:hypothetical protein